MQQLYDLVSTTNHECYVKIIVSVLDYTSDTLAKKIISKELSSQNLSCRLYCTKLLHVILRTPLHNNADIIDWVVERLVGRPYDEDRAVVNAAILAFDEACDCKICMSY
ncbi:rapamycin-insensitive companion of mTOR-like [Lycorma delicatula]|uniref:rapamycin-insensitive companion of mTOR-like n=1 Tax=Lycorma delicatula TaxID=130591 RepID=UPI003F512E72